MKSGINPSNWHTVHESPSEGRRRWQVKQRQKDLRRLSVAAVFIAVVLIGGIVFLIRQSGWHTTPLLAAGKVITVKRGANLQAAINQAQPGDTIILEAGAEFIGSFELPNKHGEEFITIQSSALKELPENTRVQQQNADAMPKILSSGKGLAAIHTAPGAHHYRFVGVEISIANTDYVYNLVDLGKDDQKQEQMPRFIEFDRCYIHTRGLNNARRGFALNSADTVIKNSYISGFAGREDETQAIAGWNGAGRYKIINNHLEGGGQNILFGGADPSVKNLVPSDIEIRNNFLTKPEAWKGKVTMKASVQLKNARRVTVSGNIIENCFGCEALVMTVRNQNGQAPWSVVEDVTFRNNIIRNVGYGINILGRDDSQKSEELKRVKIINNLFESILYAEGGFFLKICDGDEVEISYNTVFQNGNIITMHGAPTTKFVFKNNILPYNNYGVHGDNAEGGVPPALERYFPGGVLTGNVIVNALNIPSDEFVFIPRNYLLPNYSAVGFENREKSDYRLTAGSKLKGKAENGKDPGCDIEALQNAVAGVEVSAKGAAN